MNRRELDELVAHHELTPSQVERTLAIARAKPTPSEVTQFLSRALLLAGVLSLAAGVVFLVAANWSELRIIGRFVLLEALLALTLALAFWRPPPRPIGHYALLAAFIIVGALLALFGQTYQTGANVYELFLTWTLLGLPLVLAGQSTALWATWILVLNLALGLFCGLRPETGMFWLLFDSAWSAPTLLLIAMLVNLVLWIIAELLYARPNGATILAPLATSAVRRLVLTGAILFATWGGVIAITGFGPYPQHIDGWSVLWVLATLIALGVYTWRRRTDVFPLALVAASVIVLVASAIMNNASTGETGFEAMALMIAAWLIISSSVAARVILILMRSWRAAEAGA
jgi:uncharacterized membrane protein